uniref:ATP binding cassette subfamily A member 2 n=1 Tax=Hucho hucho TaxID=62062 RepID=A0A4W5PWC5_9TELE
MGFLHQLHLLLWKNVSLKRRGPWVLAFEIFIPLVLFFILLGLRQKKPAIPVKEDLNMGVTTTGFGKSTKRSGTRLMQKKMRGGQDAEC